MAAVLRGPNQLCYYVFFSALFVTYFVHNVSATVSYGKKRVSGYQDSDHSPLIIQQAGSTGHSPNTRQGQHPHYWQDQETQVQRTQSGMPREDPQEASGKSVTVKITRHCANIGQ